MQPRGVAIDEAEPPAWARQYFSADQLTLNRGLLWMLLVYKRDGLEASRISVAQRLYVHTLGKERKEANPSFKGLAADLNISERTVEPAIEDLEGEGWIVIARRRNKNNTYRLAWPLEDPLSVSSAKVELCGRPTTKEGGCTRRAGWGTDTPGVGPCKLHGASASLEPQPLRSKTSVEPQPLRSKPVDNSEHEPSSTATIAALNRNHCSLEPQPLQLSTATIAAEYVQSPLVSSLKSSYPSPVLSVGQPTVRTARAVAPSANRGGFAARSLISAIPRYRAAPGWVKKHLTVLAGAALDAGFERDAIARYAAAVIAEARFAEHQHIPEFRDALRRLGRDTALGDVPPPAEPPAVPDDTPWTDEDQAAWERILDHLAVTADDLDTTGTP